MQLRLAESSSADCRVQSAITLQLQLAIHSASFPRQPMRQVTRQRHAQVRVRPQLHVIDVLVAAAVLQLRDEALDLVQVAVAQRARVGQQLGVLLQAAEQRRFLEREVQLGRGRGRAQTTTSCRLCRRCFSPASMSATSSNRSLSDEDRCRGG